MKKIMCLAVCFLLLVPCALGETAPQQLTKEDGAYAWLYEKSMTIALRFQRGLDHTWHSYLLSAFNAPQQEMEDALSPIRGQDYTNPRSIALVRADQAVNDSALNDMARLGYAANLLPAEWEDDPLRDLYLTASSYLSAQDDERFAAVSGALRIFAVYPCPEELDGPCYALLQYGRTYDLLICFYPLEDGTVGALAQVIPAKSADALALPV